MARPDPLFSKQLQCPLFSEAHLWALPLDELELLAKQ
jgi:hypothetical protein